MGTGTLGYFGFTLEPQLLYSFKVIWWVAVGTEKTLVIPPTVGTEYDITGK